MQLRFTLVAAVAYFACIASLAFGAYIEFLPVRGVWVLAIYDGVGAIGFYFALRSPWARKLGNDGLLTPQVIYALVSLGLAYSQLPQMRSVLLVIAPLILMFSASTTTPGLCKRLSWIAVVIFGAAMLMALGEPAADIKRTAFEIAFLLVLYPAMGRVAAMNAAMRLSSHKQRAALEHALERINHLATCDDLTGLPNRRHASETLTNAVEHIKRYQQPLCIAIVDIDHFKRVNDTHGHAVGDKVLRHVAEVSRPLLRSTDMMARWGGEEFLVLLPETDLTTAAGVIERLREGQSRARPCPDDAPELRVTFSAGLVSLEPGETGEQALERADQLLYQAKSKGRDRIAITIAA